MCHVKKMLKYSLVFKLEKPYLLITKWQEFYSKLSNIQPAKLNRYYNDLIFLNIEPLSVHGTGFCF